MNWKIINNYKEEATSISICLFFLALLFIWEYPPITDFMPHLGQVQSFWWEVRTHDKLYSINWFAPNTLYYYILIFFSLVMPLILACKMLWMFIFCMQITALYWLCKKLKTPYTHFLLCLILSFNMNLYWGFGNFILAYILFLHRIIFSQAIKIKMQILVTIFIAWAHIFFLAPLMMYELLQYQQLPKGERRLNRFLPISIVFVWTASWMILDFSLKAKGNFVYNYSIAQRVSMEWLFQSIQGGIQSKSEILVAFISILLLVHFFWALTSKNKNIQIIGIIFILIGFIVPDKGMNTVRASQRWIPFGFQILLLCGTSYSNKLINQIKTYTIMIVSFVFLIATWNAWSNFQKQDIIGLKKVVTKIPKNSRLLTLDYIGFGLNFQTRSTMHAGSYAQIMVGAIPQTSFADNPAAFVRFVNPRTYSPNLEWYPNHAQLSDIKQSDIVLIGGKPEVHSFLLQSNLISPVDYSNHGIWRVYTPISSLNSKNN